MLAGGHQPVYASGECEIDLARLELRILGSAVPIGGRAFEILEVLAQSASELVTKNELMNRVWPGAVVMENTLHVHVGAVRKALGSHRALLKTESRRGYRLLGDWTVRSRDAAKPPVGRQQMQVTGESPATNFPAAVTPLIGRSAAQQRLHDLVSAYRVVTLTGPGGIGKTALALEVARSVVGEFADGVWLVDLASLSDPDLVPSAVAGALRLRLAANIISPKPSHGPSPKRSACWFLTIVNTSSTRQRRWPKHSYGCVHALRSWRLAARFSGSGARTPIVGPPLEVPTEEQVDADQILGHSAPALFVARAKELGADFSSHAESLPTIAAICRHLDGIPLAIEFASARAATIGIEEVAAGLSDRFALLTSGRRMTLPRHRTLRATLTGATTF